METATLTNSNPNSNSFDLASWKEAGIRALAGLRAEQVELTSRLASIENEIVAIEAHVGTPSTQVSSPTRLRIKPVIMANLEALEVGEGVSVSALVEDVQKAFSTPVTEDSIITSLRRSIADDCRFSIENGFVIRVVLNSLDEGVAEPTKEEN